MESNTSILRLVDYHLMNKTSCVYEIRHNKSDKFYIGRTSNLKDRARKHIQELNNCKHKNPKMQNLHNRYGDMWTIQIIKECDEEKSIELEGFILSEIELKNVLNCHKNSIGGSKGQIWTSEQRKRHSMIMKNKIPLTPDQVERHRKSLQDSPSVKVHLSEI